MDLTNNHLLFLKKKMLDMTVLPFLYVSAMFTGYIIGAYGPTRRIYDLENRLEDLESLLRKYKEEIDSVLEKKDEEDETDDEMPELVSDHLD